MLMISTRQNFTDADNSNRSSHGAVVYEAREVDLQICKPATSRVIKLSDRVKGKRVLLLIHGYNNDWVKVCNSYDILEENHKTVLHGTAEAYDAIIGVAWPGGDHEVEYRKAKRRAKEHFKPIAQLIKELKTAASVDINAHSMGCYLILSALGYYANPDRLPKIRNLFLMAAAVDDESIEKGEKFYPATRACEKVLVFHSKKDDTLDNWYPIGELRFWEKALGLVGPDDKEAIEKHSKNVRVINCSKLNIDHGGYKHQEEVYFHMREFLKRQNENKPDFPQFTTLKKRDD